MVRIITNETPTEELNRKLAEERVEMSKAAALEFGCNVEEIKFRINSAGIYEFARMTPQEMIDLTALEQSQKREARIRQVRGVNNG